MTRGCGECPPDPGAAVSAAAAAVGAGVCAVGRTLVRVAVLRLDDEQLQHGRRILVWQVPWLWAVAAGLTWWLGRPAAGIFAGIVAGSWLLGHALGAEVEHRAERAELARLRANRARVRRRPMAQPRPAPDPEVQTLDEELAGLVAADKATKEGR